MPDISIKLNEQEQAAFRQLIDAALRHAGAGALDVAAHFMAKLVSAEQGAQAGASGVPSAQPKHD